MDHLTHLYAAYEHMKQETLDMCDADTKGEGVIGRMNTVSACLEVQPRVEFFLNAAGIVFAMIASLFFMTVISFRMLGLVDLLQSLLFRECEECGAWVEKDNHCTACGAHEKQEADFLWHMKYRSRRKELQDREGDHKGLLGRKIEFAQTLPILEKIITLLLGIWFFAAVLQVCHVAGGKIFVGYAEWISSVLWVIDIPDIRYHVFKVGGSGGKFLINPCFDILLGYGIWFALYLLITQIIMVLFGNFGKKIVPIADLPFRIVEFFVAIFIGVLFIDIIVTPYILDWIMDVSWWLVFGPWLCPYVGPAIFLWIVVRIFWIFTYILRKSEKKCCPYCGRFDILYQEELDNYKKQYSPCCGQPLNLLGFGNYTDPQENKIAPDHTPDPEFAKMTEKEKRRRRYYQRRVVFPCYICGDTELPSDPKTGEWNDICNKHPQPFHKDHAYHTEMCPNPGCGELNKFNAQQCVNPECQKVFFWICPGCKTQSKNKADVQHCRNCHMVWFDYCQSCGAENRFCSIHCTQCKAPLFDQASVESFMSWFWRLFSNMANAGISMVSGVYVFVFRKRLECPDCYQHYYKRESASLTVCASCMLQLEVICETCGKEYDVNQENCPNCGHT